MLAGRRDDGDDQMKQKDNDIAHSGKVSKTPKKHLILTRFSNSPWTMRRGRAPLSSPSPTTMTISTLPMKIFACRICVGEGRQWQR